MNTIVLQSPGKDSVTIKVENTDRDFSYLRHAVLLPWTTPQRILGFIHPADEEKVGRESFTLHSCFAFYASISVQQMGPNAFRPVEGPKMLLPFEMISPITLQVHECPTVIWMREQDLAFQEMMHILLTQLVDPPRIQAAGGIIKG